VRRGGGQRPFDSGTRCAAPLTFKEVFLFSLFLFFSLGLSGAARGAAPPVPPKPAKYVTDNAGVVSAPAANRLNEKLAAFERETSNQVIFWIDRRVPEGTTLEEFANRCVHEWGVGQKGASNGVAFFLFTDERRMRMEVGYGLEGAIPDARAHRIDSEIIAPLLKAGDVGAALDAGADAIFAAVRGEPYKGTGKTAAETRRRGSPYLILLPIGFFLAVALLFLLAFRAARRAAGVSKGAYRSLPGGAGALASSSSPDSSWSSSSSSSSDSSSSSSDFSGGGGDSGGGGSSDSY
jgi:uncharacterized protein